MVSKLSAHGVAGVVLANGSMSTNTTGEGAIRQKLVENDMIDCMIARPGQLFYTTQIPVCLWFLTKSKKADKQRGYRNREGETLFIDARQIGTMISRTQNELKEADIARDPRASILTGSSGLDPNGIIYGSRGFERSEHPRTSNVRYPPTATRSHIHLRSLRDRCAFVREFRGCVAARRPPATL